MVYVLGAVNKREGCLVVVYRGKKTTLRRSEDIFPRLGTPVVYQSGAQEVPNYLLNPSQQVIRALNQEPSALERALDKDTYVDRALIDTDEKRILFIGNWFSLEGPLKRAGYCGSIADRRAALTEPNDYQTAMQFIARNGLTNRDMLRTDKQAIGTQLTPDNLFRNSGLRAQLTRMFVRSLRSGEPLTL